MLEQHAVVVADTEGVTQIWSPGAEGLSAAVGRVVAGVAAAGDLPAALRLDSGHEGRQVDRERPGEPVNVDKAQPPQDAPRASHPPRRAERPVRSRGPLPMLLLEGRAPGRSGTSP